MPESPYALRADLHRKGTQGGHTQRTLRKKAKKMRNGRKKLGQKLLEVNMSGEKLTTTPKVPLWGTSKASLSNQVGSYTKKVAFPHKREKKRDKEPKHASSWGGDIL